MPKCKDIFLCLLILLRENHSRKHIVCVFKITVAQILFRNTFYILNTIIHVRIERVLHHSKFDADQLNLLDILFESIQFVSVIFLHTVIYRSSTCCFLL